MARVYALAILAALSVASPASAGGDPAPGLEVVSPSTAPSTVTIRREKRFRESLVVVQLTMDGKPLRTIGRGETVTLQIEPGRHLLGTITGDKMGLSKPDVREIDVTLESGATYYFRMVLTPGEGFALERASSL